MPVLRSRGARHRGRLIRGHSARSTQTVHPSPSSGPPKLSESWSPPPRGGAHVIVVGGDGTVMGVVVGTGAVVVGGDVGGGAGWVVGGEMTDGARWAGEVVPEAAPAPPPDRALAPGADGWAGPGAPVVEVAPGLPVLAACGVVVDVDVCAVPFDGTCAAVEDVASALAALPAPPHAVNVSTTALNSQRTRRGIDRHLRLCRSGWIRCELRWRSCRIVESGVAGPV